MKMWTARHRTLVAFISQYDGYYVGVRGKRRYNIRSPRTYKTLAGAQREAQHMLETMEIIEGCL